MSGKLIFMLSQFGVQSLWERYKCILDAYLRRYVWYSNVKENKFKQWSCTCAIYVRVHITL